MPPSYLERSAYAMDFVIAAWAKKLWAWGRAAWAWLKVAYVWLRDKFKQVKK